MSQKIPVVLSGGNNQHIPLGDTDTIRPSDVPISRDSGNLIEARGDGLYYGITPPADVANLYVDNISGSDDNPGTRASPLKTLQAAFNKVQSGQNNTIRLKAGGNFVWPNAVVNGGATRTLMVYDDPYVDGDKVQPSTPEKTSYSGWFREALNRPKVTLNFVYAESNHTYSNHAVGVRNGAIIACYGIHFVAMGLNQPGSGLEPDSWTKDWPAWEPVAFMNGNASGTCAFQGCKFEMKYAPSVVSETNANWRYIVEAFTHGQGMPTVTMEACSHVNQTAGETNIGSPVIQMSPANGQIQIWNAGDSWGTEPGYEYLDQNLPTILNDNAAKLIEGIVRDSDGKPRNVLSNRVL